MASSVELNQLHSPSFYSPNEPKKSLELQRPSHIGPTRAPVANIIEELYGSTRKPRSFKQWEDAARENTRRIKELGSPSPLVWVLVKGKDIPANAIVAGEERRQPLYIARTFYEGGICMVLAKQDVTWSVVLPSLEVQVETYEVLVPALQPLRYSISDTIHMPSIPRIVAERKEIKRLNLIKTVVLVDDSASMAGVLWAEAREALAGIADLNAQVSADGADLYFMNDVRFSTNLKDGDEVRRLFDTVVPCGETPAGQKLQQIFDKYIPLIENKNSLHRPITIAVITDGVPTDEPKDIIINAARRLDRNEVPLKKFGIQFTQIGDDIEATEALQELDDDLAGCHGIRDMVDTTPYNRDSKFSMDRMVKILIGAIDDTMDAVQSPASHGSILFQRFMAVFEKLFKHSLLFPRFLGVDGFLPAREMSISRKTPNSISIRVPEIHSSTAPNNLEKIIITQDK